MTFGVEVARMLSLAMVGAAGVLIIENGSVTPARNGSLSRNSDKMEAARR